jgi:hypothetical protein
MVADKYRQALRETIHEYEALARQRAEIDGRMARLIQAIGSLSRLCNLTPTVSFGLTDACRMALKAAGHPLTVTEIRMQLEAMGFDLSRYSNPQASIHIVLKRLCRAEEAKFTPRAHEKPTYAWKKPLKIIALESASDLGRMSPFWLGGKGGTSDED